MPVQTLWGNGTGKGTNILIRQKWHRHHQKKYGGLENAATDGRLHPKTGDFFRHIIESFRNSPSDAATKNTQQGFHSDPTEKSKALGSV